MTERLNNDFVKEEKQFKQFMRSRLDEGPYSTFIEPIRIGLIDHTDGDCRVTLVVPNQFFAMYIEENYADDLQEALEAVVGTKFTLVYSFNPEVTNTDSKKESACIKKDFSKEEEQFKQLMKSKLDEEAYSTWIAPIHILLIDRADVGCTITLLVPNQAFMLHLNEHYNTSMQEALLEVLRAKFTLVYYFESEHPKKDFSKEEKLFKQFMQEKIDQQEYDTWIAPIRIDLIDYAEGGCAVTLAVPLLSCALYLDGHYSSLIKEALEQAIGEKSLPIYHYES